MIVKVEKIKKAFGEHVIFDDFSLNVEENSFCVLYGKSGCGKSTLLNMIGLLEPYDEGNIYLFNEKNVRPFSKKAQKLLQKRIGYLFQNFALEESESVEYNLRIAMMNEKLSKAEKKKRIDNALEMVQLKGYEKKKIHECSGGEQQRIAIARLLCKPCDLILADEPTGSLDRGNKEMIFALLQELQNQGKTLIVVTHDEELIELGDQKVKLK